MRQSYLTVFALILLSPDVAMAGFEWLPPSQGPSQIAQPEHNATAPMPAGQYQTGASQSGMAVPPAQVMQQPLSVPPAQRTSTHMGAANMAGTKNLSGGGLYIDPYPLQQDEGQVKRLSAASVGQAMAEESRMLNPLRLGAGLKTGAQPQQADMNAANWYRRDGDVSYQQNRDALQGGDMAAAGTHMTPMAPLAGDNMTGNHDIAAFNAAFDRQYGANPPSAGAGYGSGAPVYKQAVGFGRDLPLALALSQVIPAGFTHRYAPNVDAGEIVSWQGGAPWDQVLNQMLRPKGLMADISGNEVIIRPLARL